MNIELPDWLETIRGHEYLGNDPLRWVAALAVLVLGFLVLRLARGLFARRLERLAGRTETELDDLVAELIDRTHALFLFVAALYAAGAVLELAPGVDRVLLRIFTIGLFLQAGIWGNRVLMYLLRRHLGPRDDEDVGRPALYNLFGFFGQLAVWSMVVLLTLDNLGFDVTALIAGLGIGGVAVALALQNVLGDTFAALSIALDKPFQVGDFLIVGDYLGTVERIGIKTTRLRSLGGEQLVFGNNDLLSSRVRNYKRMWERRVVFSFGVVYQTTADQLEEICDHVREIIDEIEDARLDRVHFKAFADSSLDYEVVYYVKDPDYNLYMDVQQRINLSLVRRFEEAGIGFAYPTRTLYLDSQGEAMRVEVESTAGETARDEG